MSPTAFVFYDDPVTGQIIDVYTYPSDLYDIPLNKNEVAELAYYDTYANDPLPAANIYLDY